MEELDDAVRVEKQCHEHEHEYDEEAWGDVNDCRVDLAKVRAARQAEIDYFRTMRVYDTGIVQKCKDGEDAYMC